MTTKQPKVNRKLALILFVGCAFLAIETPFWFIIMLLGNVYVGEIEKVIQ